MIDAIEKIDAVKNTRGVEAIDATRSIEEVEAIADVSQKRLTEDQIIALMDRLWLLALQMNSHSCALTRCNVKSLRSNTATKISYTRWQALFHLCKAGVIIGGTALLPEKINKAWGSIVDATSNTIKDSLISPELIKANDNFQIINIEERKKQRKCR